MIVYIPKYLYYHNTFQSDMAVVVEDGRIIDIDHCEHITAIYPEARKEVWDNLVMIPGSVNVHNHSFQSLLRGIATDRPFLEWRDKALYHYSPLMTKEDIYVGALFAFAEMMKRGVTCVSDFFYLHNYGLESDEAIIKAAQDVGIRLVLARTMYDWKGAPAGYVESIEQAVENTSILYKKYQENDMVNILPAPHSLHAASPEMIIQGHELACKLGTKFHIHVAEEMFEVDAVEKEHGMGTIEYLNHIGVLDEHMVLIHGVWLKDNEIELIGEKGAHLAYCPSSNMFLADGITNIPKMLENHVNIGLGSDGACSNNRISIFEEMRMVSILQKAKTCDAMCMNYKTAFEMGTVNGGKLLDLPIGLLEKGMKADFIGVDLEDLSMMPISDDLEQILPNIVYSMEPTAIKEVVIDGVKTIQKGEVVSVSEKEVKKKIKETMNHLNQGGK